MSDSPRLIPPRTHAESRAYEQGYRQAAADVRTHGVDFTDRTAALMGDAATTPPDLQRAALLDKLRELRHEEPETGHMDADAALLDFIADDEIRAAFDEICKWYS